MKKAIITSILIALLGLFSPPAIRATSNSSAQEIYSSLRRLEKSSRQITDNEKAIKFTQAFDEYLEESRPQNRLRSYSDADLLAVFNASDLATFYSFEPRHALFMESVLNELNRRDLATPQQWSYLSGAFIQSRMFSRAIEIRSAHELSSQQELPTLVMAATKFPYEWTPDKKENKLTLQNLDLPKGPSILIFAHPLCHFTQNALRDIENSPQIRTIFKIKAKLLVPPSRTFDLSAVQDWNRDHQSQQMNFAFSRQQLPNFQYWETPAFYFLLDGEIVDTVVGWPKEGHIDQLILAAHKIGL